MHIVMVKKRLRDGSECKKCAQVTQLLQQRGYWDRIQEVVWADERDAASSGMQLANTHRITTAPFFIVQGPDRETVYTSALQFMRDCFQHTPSRLEQLAEEARTNSERAGLP